MLKLAIESEVPLIRVVTDDPIHAPEIIRHIAAPYKCEVCGNEEPGLTTLKDADVVVMVGHQKADHLPKLFRQAEEFETAMVFVNPEYGEHPAFFEAGPLAFPQDMLRAFLFKHGHKGKALDALVTALGGLSYKQVREVARMTETRDHSLTPPGVYETRRTVVRTSRGVEQVNAAYLYYLPPKALTDWLKVSGKVFLSVADIPAELIPRGLLFDGPPGVGKTQGAKYLARQLGLPLFRLDLGSVLGKYVGESEAGMQIALAQIDRAAPCVLLIDEIEKVFQGSKDDSGVTPRLLSSLLWWLQEHTSRVLTLMTTNARESLPPEVYRTGRVDSVVKFEGLSVTEGRDFARKLLQALGYGSGQVWHMVKTELDARFDPNANARPAHVEWAQAVYDVVRESLVQTQGGV